MRSFKGGDKAHPSRVNAETGATTERSSPHIIDNPALDAITGAKDRRAIGTLMLTLVALSPLALGMVESFPAAAKTADIAEPCGPLYGTECVEAPDIDDAMGLGLPISP